MKFTTHLVALDFEKDTATFHLPPGTRMGTGSYSIELQASGQPATAALAPPLDLLQRIRQHLPLAAACWNEDENRKVADFNVAAVLALVKEIDAVLAGSPPQIRGDVSTGAEQQRQPFEVTDDQIAAIANSMPGGLEGFLKGWGWQQFARKVLELRAPPTWEPQFDVMSPTQEELVKQYCAEIAGPKGEPGRPPDPVRLLEMAQELYLAERRECGP